MAQSMEGALISSEGFSVGDGFYDFESLQVENEVTA